jgi:16S rRNA (cytosine967-C5)-methyltransferase
MQTARDIVFSLLRKWTTLSDPPFLPERSDELFARLSPRDRPFAFDLITGVIRWRKTLDAVIASRLKQPLESLDHAVLALLWLGAYQLLFQSGTSDYAAVDTTVDLARRNRDTTRAGGLVNAVLRNITRLNPTIEPRKPGLARHAVAIDFDRQLTFSEDIFLRPEANPIGHLAQVRSHPPQYVEHLRNLFGETKAAELLLRNNLRPVITLRADTKEIDVPAAAGLVPHAETPRFLVAENGWNAALEELVTKGILSPQDPTAARPIRQLETLVTENALLAPRKILDLCAGLGTKTLQLARAFPNAAITATDIDPNKLVKLQARIQQVRQTNITVLTPDHWPLTTASDLVLIDAPCSNTGVMAKRVQSRWRWPTLDHAALHNLQQKLLVEGLNHLAPSGALLYSTCSIDPAENDKLIANFLGIHPTLTLFHQQTTLPSLTNAPTQTHDGGYFAILTHTVSV